MVFASTYAIYKQGTSQVVSWLGKTAAQCGYAAFGTAVLTSQPEKTSETRSSKSNNQKDAQSQPSNTKYTLSSRELPVLAKYIKEHFRQTSAEAFKGSLRRTLEVLKDVIHRRKQWARDFKLPDPSTHTSNERHKYFVAILQEVQLILEGLMAAVQSSLNGASSGEAEEDGESLGNKSQSTEEKAQSVDEKALSNMFAILEIEEPTEMEDDNTKPAKNRPPNRPPTVTYEQEDENSIEEAYFRVYCYFKDFQGIRPQIIKGWADYKKGTVDLAAVAITTNVYLEMLQRAETELIASLPENLKLTNFESISNLLVNDVALKRGVSQNPPEGKYEINMELKDVHEFVCLPAYTIVKSFVWSILERFKDGDIPVMKPGYFGKVDMSGKPMSFRKRFKQEMIVILEFLPEFCILEKMKKKFAVPILDQLSRGLIEMLKTRKVPIWLVLGCRIHLDIHRTMLSSMDMAHKQLQAVGQHVSTTIQAYNEFSKVMEIATWPELFEKDVQVVKLEADLWVNRDPFLAAQKKIFEEKGYDAAPYGLLSRHPILCGVFLFHLNLRLQQAGTRLVTSWGSLPSVVHLYNAVKHECPKDQFLPWEDLEAIITIEGKENIFVGDFPTSADKYYKSFCLFFGYSASMFAPNRHGRRNITNLTRKQLIDRNHSSRGPRAMAATCSVADVFLGQYCDNNYTLVEVNKIYNANANRPEDTLVKFENFLNESAAADGKKRVGLGKKRSPLLLTTSSLLSALQTRIQEDTLALNIDYFALHMRCINLLRDIRVKFDLDFRRICELPDIPLRFEGQHLEYLENEGQLSFLVGFIFLIYADGTVAKKSAFSNPKILRKAGDLIRDLVAKEGSNEVDRVRKLYSGYNRQKVENQK